MDGTMPGNGRDQAGKQVERCLGVGGTWMVSRWDEAGKQVGQGSYKSSVNDMFFYIMHFVYQSCGS